MWVEEYNVGIIDKSMAAVLEEPHRKGYGMIKVGSDGPLLRLYFCYGIIAYCTCVICFYCGIITRNSWLLLVMNVGVLVMNVGCLYF